MTVKPVPQKTDSAAPKPDAKKKDAPKAAKVATEEAKAVPHHATLTTPFTEVVCSECTVGLLKKYINPSLRKQRELDPTNQKYHLKDNEEIEFIRDKPLTLQLIGLRREQSLSNKFDDLLVVLYDPALLKEEEAEEQPEAPKAAGKKKEKKPILDGTGLRKENLASTQAFVDKILADKEWPPLKDWPLPGTDVSCLQCKHWRVLIFPITTDPGYDNAEPNKKDENKKDIPNFDDWTLLPNDIGSVAPGIYNSHYRVGLHKGSRKPHTSFAALQLVPDSIPARRRYPIQRYLKRAQLDFDKKTDGALRASLFSKDAKGYKAALAAAETELKAMPRGTAAEKKAFTQAVQERLAVLYAPQVLELRKEAARVYFQAVFKDLLKGTERFIRLEAANGDETRNFEKDGSRVAHMKIADDSTSPFQLGIQLVFEAPPAPSPPVQPKPTEAASPPSPVPAEPAPLAPAPVKPAPPPLLLKKEDILVTFGTATATNIHRSTDDETVAWKATREVNNWSEGCQVFRSPKDYKHFMRLSMLSKRAHCPARTDKCCEPLTVKDVEAGIGPKMTEYLAKLPDDFAEAANKMLKDAFPPPPPQETTATNDTAVTKTGAKKATAPAAKSASKPTVMAPNAPAATTVEVNGKKTEAELAAEALALKSKQHNETLMKLLTESAAYKDFETQLEKIYRTAFPPDEYYDKDVYAGIVKYAQSAVVATMKEQSTPEEIKTSVTNTVEALTTKMNSLKETWLKDMYTAQINSRHKEFLADGLEPCDFGNCGFRFDYMLADISRKGMEEFVSKLEAREWNVLFPQEAPPPAPKPAKTAKPSKN